MNSRSSSSAAADSGDCWQLQEAKARFSEVVRRAGERGPQHVTVNGQKKAVVLSAEDYLLLRGRPTGKLLVELMGDSPLADVTMEHLKTSGPVLIAATAAHHGLTVVSRDTSEYTAAGVGVLNPWLNPLR